VRKINPALLLLFFLVLIAAMFNFLVASQRMAMAFYFLPALYSAYHFGRRYATLTSCLSILLVASVTYVNPSVFNLRVELPFYNRWFELAGWAGILLVASYAMGTLYERNQKSLRELKDGYDGILAVLQHCLTNEKYSDANSQRVSAYATKIAETLGLDRKSVEDVRTAALLRNVNELGVSNEMLFKAANLSQEDKNGDSKRSNAAAKARAAGGALCRVIPILVAEQQLAKTGGDPADAPLEVQVLNIAQNYESLVNGAKGKKLSPEQAEETIVKGAGKKYDSLVVDAFVKAFGQKANAASVS
jgi:hypothetical protein